MSNLILPRRELILPSSVRRKQGGFLLNPYRFATGDSDPYWSNVVLLLHMDGADASTTFTDEKGHTVTANGNAHISTAQSKFGGTSYAGDGSGDYLSVASSTDFDLLGGDFTIEFWCKNNRTNDDSSTCFCVLSSSNNYFQILVRNALVVHSYNGTHRELTASGYTLDTNWHHIAFVKLNGTYYIFWDGVSLTLSGSGPVSLGTSFHVYVGSNSISSTYSYNGYIDDLRITKGVARYTSNFTAPSAAFPNQ
jgi:hypothetical protein